MDNNGKRDSLGGDIPGSPNPDGELEIIFVPPTLADEAWPLIRGAVGMAREYSMEPWDGEDVLREVKAGRAHLLLACEDTVAGVLVMRFLEKFDGNKEARIWIFWAKKNFYGHFHLLEKYAKHYGANEVTFASPRKGWLKIGKKLGFEPAEIIYRKRLT